VLIEKPGAISLGEIERLQALAVSQNKILRVGYNHRFHPAFLMARSLLEEEKFGKLLWVRARYGHGGRLGYDKEWRSQKDVSGGGELIDQGSHLLDLLRYLVGEVELVFSEIQTAFWDMEVEDNVYLALRPQVGGFAWLHASWSEWKNTFSFEITLETAKLEINGLGGSYGTETLTLYQMKPEMGPPDHQTWQWEAKDSSWDKEMEDILKNIDGSPFVGSNVADGIAVLKIIEQVYTNDH
jgi:predicted dehydrogenase